MRITFWQPQTDIEDAYPNEFKSNIEDDGKVVVGIRTAKRLLKEYGGRAWTEHFERDGTMFEVTEVLLTGNNSNHHYNHHL